MACRINFLAPETAAQVACGDTYVHFLKAGKGNVTGSTNIIVFYEILQRVDLRFPHNGVENVSQPFVKH